MRPGSVLYWGYSPGFTHQVCPLTLGIASIAVLNCLKTALFLSPGSQPHRFPIPFLPVAASRILSHSNKALEQGEFSSKTGAPLCRWVSSVCCNPAPSLCLGISGMAFFHWKTSFSSQIFPSKDNRVCCRAGGEGDRLVGFNPGERLLLPTRFWRVTPDARPEK